jgi:hypothetical protein
MSAKAGIERIAKMMARRNDRIRYLEQRVLAAETALATFDYEDQSEYWSRYPKTMGQELSESSGDKLD